MAGPEDMAYRQQLLATGQADPLPGIMSQVTLQIRNAIRSAPRNQLHEDPTYLPEGAIYQAVAIARFRLLSRFAIGGDDQPGDARTTEYREAIRWMDLVRSGKELIEPPYGTGAESSGAGQMEQVTATRRRADREGLKGL